MCCATYKEEPGVAVSTFNGGWGTRWWRDVSGWSENEGLPVGLGEDGNVGVHDVTGDRNESRMLDGGWNFCWDDSWVSDEKDTKLGEVMRLVGLVATIWSEVVLSGEENTWWKSGDAGNVWNFSGAVGELSKKFWHLGLKNVAVTDSDWDEDDWETEERLNLGKLDGGCDLINDDCDKHDDDNYDDDCGDNTSCNVSIITLENLMFPFSIRWRRSL